MRPLRLARVLVHIIWFTSTFIFVLLPAVGQRRAHGLVGDPQKFVEVFALHAQDVARVVSNNVVHAMLGHRGCCGVRRLKAGGGGCFLGAAGGCGCWGCGRGSLGLPRSRCRSAPSGVGLRFRRVLRKAVPKQQQPRPFVVSLSRRAAHASLLHLCAGAENSSRARFHF